jgi:hypothetical protein
LKKHTRGLWHFQAFKHSRDFLNLTLSKKVTREMKEKIVFVASTSASVVVIFWFL